MCLRDGKSRQFAFIGFRTESEAEEAIKYFNKSFLDTSRITCEVCNSSYFPFGLHWIHEFEYKIWTSNVRFEIHEFENILFG